MNDTREIAQEEKLSESDGYRIAESLFIIFGLIAMFTATFSWSDVVGGDTDGVNAFCAVSSTLLFLVCLVGFFTMLIITYLIDSRHS